MADTLLKVENLVKEYDGQRILDGIDLTLAQGEVVVVVGPSGCGKTTTLRILGGFAPLYQCIRARAGRFDQPAWQGYPQGQQKYYRNAAEDRNGIPELRAVSTSDRA